MRNRSWAFILAIPLILLAGCGGSASTAGGGAGPVITRGQAQGVYAGTASGYTFDAIVLPDDSFYAVYGTTSGSQLFIYGMMIGKGTSNNGKYTATYTDYYNSGTTVAGTINASYVAGSSFTGTISENGSTMSFSATSLPASVFNYNTPALLSDVVGTWMGVALDGTPIIVTINPNGTFSGSAMGCAFSGTAAPDASNKNFFNITLTFGGSPCLLPNQTARGIAIDELLPDGATHQLLAGGVAGNSGTGFIAQR